MDTAEAIARLIKGYDLRKAEMTSLIRQIMLGGVPDLQMGGFLVALSMKGEMILEISAAIEVLRELVSEARI